MVELTRGSIAGEDDLTINVVDNNGSPIDPYRIDYALYDYTTGSEVLIGPSQRDPVKEEVGTYYAAFQIPEDATYGTYRIRWTLQETSSSSTNQVMEEFDVVKESELESQIYSSNTLAMIETMRRMLRDNNPDRNYHFRPPTSSGTVNEYNRVFSYIWEDAELVEYMDQAVAAINAHPPETHYKDLDKMLKGKPNWKSWVTMGAISYATLALTLNWIADEFSVTGDTEVRVELPSGREVSLTIEELYKICCEGDDE